MGIFKGIYKGVVKPAVDVPRWIGWDSLKDQTVGMWRAVKPIFTPPKQPTGQTETFDAVVARLNLSEEALARKAKFLFYHSLIYLSIGFLLTIYFFILFAQQHFWIALLVLILTALAFVKALHAHFWYFQIKHKKIGCRLSEWFSAFFQGAKK